VTFSIWSNTDIWLLSVTKYEYKYAGKPVPER